MTVTIARMTRPDLDTIVGWAAAEGWNPGRQDADCCWAADPQGFFWVRQEGEPIGCISAVRYSVDFGFIGFYIVLPPWRGQGYGLQLWHTAMAYLEGCTIGLDGVVAQQPNYERSGFRMAYRHLRYEYRGPIVAGIPTEAIMPLDTVPIEQLFAFDRTVFPAIRQEFLRHWIAQPDARALAYINQDRLLGYGMLRPSQNGYRLGPLCAHRESIAEILVTHLLSTVEPEMSVCIDVPDANPAALSLVHRYGMQPIFVAARMYNRTPPTVEVSRIFGVTSLELG